MHNCRRYAKWLKWMRREHRKSDDRRIRLKRFSPFVRYGYNATAALEALRDDDRSPHAFLDELRKHLVVTRSGRFKRHPGHIGWLIANRKDRIA